MIILAAPGWMSAKPNLCCTRGFRSRGLRLAARSRSWCCGPAPNSRPRRDRLLACAAARARSDAAATIGSDRLTEIETGVQAHGKGMFDRCRRNFNWIGRSCERPFSKGPSRDQLAGR